MTKTISIYYSPAPLLSQKCIFNYVIGNRGGGKSFSGKVLAINRFKKKGKQFIYLRRYQTELDEITDYFADVRFKFPEDKLEQKGSNLYINGELAGYMIALSKSMSLKSNPYPLVTTIIFDEFIIDKGRLPYLKNEPQLLEEFYDTVDRSRDETVVLAFGNAISIVNPHFVYFGVYPDLNKRFTKDKEKSVCIEFYFNEEFIAKKKATRFGQSISQREYGQYNLYNKFLRDSDSFIKKRPATANYKLYQFVIEGVKYSLWQDVKYQCYYIDNNYEKNFGTYRTYVADPNEMDDTDKSMILLKKNNATMKRLKVWLERGDLYFNNQTTKQKFYEIMLTN
ncbi:MAG: phage DNA encapsidation protein [Clostridia bacterium]|nr:phage DNA encapsidation protein [Clostridia bacterium]